MQRLIWAEEPLKSLTGAEWGFIGTLTFVIVGAFTLLLKYVLNQASEDRKLFKETTDSNIRVLQEISITMRSMQAEIARLREDIDDWRNHK